jgi:hypothetical protein
VVGKTKKKKEKKKEKERRYKDPSNYYFIINVPIKLSIVSISLKSNKKTKIILTKFQKINISLSI